MKTAVMTDTNSGISENLATELGIYVIHMPVIIDDETYYEGDTISEQDFFTALQSEKKVSTSMPSPADVIDLWNTILSDGYDELVYIPMSSGLSNSCSVAKGLADDFDNHVEVVDNHRISVTLYQSVLQAKELANQGKTAKEIRCILEEDAYNSSIYLAVNTLEYLKKGGRITPAAAMIGSVLSIKPILTIQGERLDSFTKVRGPMRKAEEKMITAIRQDLNNRFENFDRKQLHIGAAGASLTLDEQTKWLDMLRNEFPNADIIYLPLSDSISVHTGPSAVGIGICFR